MNTGLAAEYGVNDFPDADIAPAADAKPALPAIIDAADFLAEKIALPPELVSGILHRGSKLVLGGGSKTFKTWVLFALAVAVATGHRWLDFVTVQGRVLFVNFEIQPGFFQKRLDAILKAQGITLNRGQLEIWNLRGHAANYGLLLPQIQERAKGADYALIVLDPIYKLYGTTDENSAMAVALLLNAVESLAVNTGAAVAFGAHYSKGNQASKESIDRISGSGVFARDPDSILNFTRHEEQNAFTVEPTLRNFQPVEPFVVRWEYPLMRLDDSLDPAKLKKPGGRPRNPALEPARLLSFIAHTTPENGMSISAWADAAKVSRNSLRERLTEMRVGGLIATAGEGNAAKQHITAKGKALLPDVTERAT